MNNCYRDYSMWSSRCSNTICAEEQNEKRWPQIGCHIEHYYLQRDEYEACFFWRPMTIQILELSNPNRFPKVIMGYKNFSDGVDRLNQRISSYIFDRKSKRNWLRRFLFFLSVSSVHSYVCYHQWDRNELSYLDYLVSVAKFSCCGAKWKNIERPPSAKKYELSAIIQLFTIHSNSEMHLSIKGTLRRCAKCSTNEAQVWSSIQYSSYKLAFCVTEEKIFSMEKQSRPWKG